MIATKAFIHELALCESDDVGDDSQIWAFAHVMKGVHIGTNSSIGDHAFIETGGHVGNNVTVKNGVMIWEGVRIEDGAFIGPGVIFTNDHHPRSSRQQDIPEIAERYSDKQIWLLETRIGKGASLGARAVIGPGVTIGDYAMVGAGSVVTNEVAPYSLVVGVPATAHGTVCRSGMTLTKIENGNYSCSRCGRNVFLGAEGVENGC